MGLLHEGQVIRGTYEVERQIGEGAFGEVYRVKHRFFGRQAMKVFKMVGMTIEETEQMLGEAILLSRVAHPNIIHVFEANVTDTSKGVCGFFTMEYVAGGSLEQFWKSHGAQLVPIATTVEIMRQVSRGLTVAHGQNPPLIHRDIKPQNILVGYDIDGLRARITDFGLAKRVNPLTLMVTAMGTRMFKAPEVFKNVKWDSCAGDIWAMGTTLYLLLTDRLPYGECDPDDMNDQRFHRHLIPPSRLNVQVDGMLDQIVYRALTVRPDDRYPNAMALLADLEKWKPQKTVSAAKSSSGSEVSKNAFGLPTPADEPLGRQMAAQAILFARQPGKLKEAADLMEEAFNKWPNLREQYEYHLQMWRRGISVVATYRKEGKP